MDGIAAPSASTTDAEVARRVAATVRPDVQALSAYHVAKADGLIKLDAMESPYPPTPALRERVARAIAEVAINRYPDGPATRVKHALRATTPVPAKAALVVGNGSDEILQIATTAVARPGAVVLSPDPSFVMYRLDARFANLRYVDVPLRADFSLDTGAMLDAIARESPALVWIAYPNNPTGNRFDRADVERIVRAAPGLVAIDEAYYAYASDSFLPRVLDYENVIVVRTVSKIGMAGLRLGYAAGHPAWIAELDKVRPPYNVNSLTQAAACALLEAGDELSADAAAIRSERERLRAALAAMPGIETWPSETNFVLARVPDARRAFDGLVHAGILVKNLDGWHPLLARCLRITVGTPAENDALLRALAKLT